LFWKKKKLEIDSIIHDTKDKRNAYRYEFVTGDCITIIFKEKERDLLDISAGGMAFNNDGFQQFDFDYINFSLSIPGFIGDSSIYAGLRILRIDDKNICHCIFEQCSLEQHELIHKYVLEMQKNDLTH
jgi:hypothetical protein